MKATSKRSTSKPAPAGGSARVPSAPAGPWTPERIRALRQAYGWTIEQAAEQVRSPRRTWSRWEQPEGPSARSPRGTTIMILEQLETVARRKGLLI